VDKQCVPNMIVAVYGGFLYRHNVTDVQPRRCQVAKNLNKKDFDNLGRKNEKKRKKKRYKISITV